VTFIDTNVYYPTSEPEEILYVAGRMSGVPEHNIPLFNATAADLKAVGYGVENPADNEGTETTTYADYIRMGLVQLMRSTGVALLDEWWKSPGARLEVAVAGMLDLPIRTAAEWLARKETN
jgi:hypothetical protein